MSIKAKIKLGGLIFCIAIIACVIFGIYIAMPDTIAIVDSNTAVNNYSREDFYTEYISIKLENQEDVEDKNEEILESSVVNNPIAVVKRGWGGQVNLKSKEADEYLNLAQVADIQGVDYLWEAQKGKLWKSYHPPKSDIGVTMVNSGCFFYAVTAAITNNSGYWYTVKDCITDLGGIVTLDSYGTYQVTNSPIETLTGGITLANKIFSVSGSGITAVSAKSLDEALSNNNMAIIYATTGSKGILSSGGRHWLCCVGSDANNYYFLNNSSRGTAVPKSTVANIELSTIWKLNNTVAVPATQ